MEPKKTFEEYKEELITFMESMPSARTATNWEHRLQTCVDCSSFTTEPGYTACGECMCPIRKVVLRNNSTCPLKKW